MSGKVSIHARKSRADVKRQRPPAPKKGRRIKSSGSSPYRMA